ncbi:hypothetical protein SLA2020_278200 [Shorea laevis]
MASIIMKILHEHHYKFWKNYKPLPHKRCFRLANPLFVLTARQDLPRPSKLPTSLAGGWDVTWYTAEPPLPLSPAVMRRAFP